MKTFKVEILVKKGGYFRSVNVLADTKKDAKHKFTSGPVFDILEELGLPQNSAWKYNTIYAV